MLLQKTITIYNWKLIHIVHRPFSSIKLDLKCITIPDSYELLENKFATKSQHPQR